MSELSKVYRGDRVRIPASTYNAFIDAARDYQDRLIGLERVPERWKPQSDVVLVRNDSGAAKPQFAVLGINAPIVSPQQNELEFKRRVALSAVVPQEEHLGRFVVLAEPIAAGGIGRAYASGVCPVRVSATGWDYNIKGADIAAGQTDSLCLSESGTASILWVDEPVDNEAWAIVRFGHSSTQQEFPISFWPTLRVNENGQMRLFVAPGRVRIRGQAADTFDGGEYIPRYCQKLLMRKY